MFFNFGKWYKNFESSCTLLSKVVELWQLSQLYNFAKLRKLPKVEVDVFLMKEEGLQWQVHLQLAEKCLSCELRFNSSHNVGL